MRTGPRQTIRPDRPDRPQSRLCEGNGRLCMRIIEQSGRYVKKAAKATQKSLLKLNYQHANTRMLVQDQNHSASEKVIFQVDNRSVYTRKIKRINAEFYIH
jgi:hypothetical protein